MLVKLGKQPKIICLTGAPAWLNEALRGNHALIDIKHCVIEVDGKYMDNRGAFDKVTDIPSFADNRCYDIVELTTENIKYLNTQVRGWNTRFNRDQTLDITRKLKKIAKNLEVSK